jgi:hypothetical protein
MIDVIATSFAVKLVTAVLAYIIIRLVLRRLDKASHISFMRWYQDADSKSRSIYFSARILAVSFLFATILSS